MLAFLKKKLAIRSDYIAVLLILVYFFLVRYRELLELRRIKVWADAFLLFLAFHCINGK